VEARGRRRLSAGERRRGRGPLGAMQFATVKLKKWGNSLAIRIPSRVLKDMDLALDDHLVLWSLDGEMHLVRMEMPTPTFGPGSKPRPKRIGRG
jgi:hypothetical protein